MSRYELQPFPWDSPQIARLKALFSEAEQAHLAQIGELEAEVVELREQVARLARDLEARKQWVEIVSRGRVGMLFPTWH